MKPGFLLWLGAAAAISVGPTAAKEAPKEQKRPALPRGRALSVGVGIGAATMTVAGEAAGRFAPTLVARIGVDPGNRLQLVGELQPAQVRSPIIDESFTAANLMAGVSFGGETRLRLLFGFQYRSWSGSQRIVARDSGPVVGLDLAHEIRLSDRLSLAPEVVFRTSVIEVEGGVGSRYLGAQCVLSWRPGASRTPSTGGK